MKQLFLMTLLVLSPITQASTFEISVSGYTAEVGEHKAEGNAHELIVISLHGKEKGRRHDGNLTFADELAANGYTTYTPQMPWYEYKAPLSTAYEVLDALIKKVAKGKKVVVTGHSQGAPFALFYTTDHKPPAEVVGSVLLAPGHLIHRSYKIQRVTAESVLRAKQLLAEGAGDQVQEFDDFNGGGGIGNKTITTTPLIYLSYFDLDTTPNFLDFITKTRLPLLWVDGKKDRLAKRMSYDEIYASAREHPQNHYTTVEGGHVSMWENAAPAVTRWLNHFR